MFRCDGTASEPRDAARRLGGALRVTLKKRMKLTKPEYLGGVWRSRLRFVESGFAAYAQCYPDHTVFDGPALGGVVCHQPQP